MIRIFTTYYNSAKYFTKTYDSLINQSVKDWKCYVTDDLSTDDSSAYIQFMLKDDKRFEYILNTQKMWQTGNYYQCVHKPEIDNEDICITVDGDDWLPDNEVFSRVLGYYKDNTLMTFGQFVIYHGEDKPMQQGFSRKPTPITDVRRLPWTSSHLRTFKAGLFRRVRKQDLLDHNNSDFMTMAGDVACFSPCIEMAGEDRVKYVNDVNYVYNVETNLNEFKVNIAHSILCAQTIAQRPKYDSY